MKKACRVLQGLVAAAVISAMAAGCGGNASNTAATASTAAAAESAAAAEPATAAAVTDTSASIPNLLWYLPGSVQPGQADVMTYVNGILNEKYGLNLDLEYIDWGSYNDKMNMIIASQENYDLCFSTEGWMNFYLPNVAKGAYADITDLIDKDAPELRQVMPSYIFDQLKVKGRIYGITNYQIEYTEAGIQVKTPLLEKYNFDLNSVKTYQDLEPLLEKLKNGEPDYYPVHPEIQTLDLNNDDILLDNSAGIRVGFKKSDPNMTVQWFQDDYKALNDLLNKWFKAGYIRSDMAVVTDDSADLSAGKYLTYVGCGIKPGGEQERTAKTADHSQYSGVGLQTPFVRATAAIGALTCVSSSSKNPDAAVKLIGVMNTNADVMNAINFGLEGVSYTLDQDGKIVENDDPPYWINGAWLYGNQFIVKLMQGQDDGIWEETDRVNHEAEASPVTGFTFDPTPVSSEIAKITAAGAEFTGAGFLGGMCYMDDYENLFTQYVAKINAAGLDTYLAEIQKQLDQWRQSH